MQNDHSLYIAVHCIPCNSYAHPQEGKCGILTSVDSDEPVQPPFKLRNSVRSVVA